MFAANPQNLLRTPAPQVHLPQPTVKTLDQRLQTTGQQPPLVNLPPDSTSMMFDSSFGRSGVRLRTEVRAS